MRFIEDSWVEAASGRIHQVFSTNYDVLTQCGRWLPAEGIGRMVTTGPYPPVSPMACKSCERIYRKSVPA